MFGLPYGGVAASLTPLPDPGQSPGGMPMSGNMPQPVAQPQTPFMWGAGGQRMTPAEIDSQRRIASQKMRADYSPVQHWSQGLARVANNITGALDMREADKAARANADAGAQIAYALANPSAPAPTPIPDTAAAPNGRGGLVGLLGRIF